MAWISVADAAEQLGVNVQRVHQRIADGSLPAERVGHQWVIDDADLARLDRRPPGRPLSARSAWVLALVAGLDDEASTGRASLPPDITASERSRARARLRGFLGDALEARRSDPEAAVEHVAAGLRGLLRHRARRRTFRVSPRDLAVLRADGRVIASGLSLPASGIGSGDVVEGYVHADHGQGLLADFLLSEARHAAANVVLHVVDRAVIPRREDRAWELAAPRRRPRRAPPTTRGRARGADRRRRGLSTWHCSQRAGLMTTEQPPTVMPVMSSEQTASWHGLMDLHVRVPTDWTLVGGQLVHLHCAERGGHRERATDDIDAVVHVRTASDVLETFTRADAIAMEPEHAADSLARLERATAL
jgi:excisionase family DNA binding protein